MTQPPNDANGTTPPSDSTPTEPIPPLAPAGGAPAQPYAFTPAEPEPAPAWLPPAPASGAAPGAAPVAPGPVVARPRSTGSSRGLTAVLVAAFVVAAVGVAFAAGRLTSPGSGSALVADDGGAGTGTDRGGGPQANGGSLPDSSFDLNGNGNGDGNGNGGNGFGNGGNPPGGGFPGDDDNDGAIRGRGFGPFGGVGLSGTVTAVADDSVTIRTDSGLTVTVGRDGTTTYHQQAPAASSDLSTGDKVQVQLSGPDGFRPGQGNDGTLDLGTAGDITIVP